MQIMLELNVMDPTTGDIADVSLTGPIESFEDIVPTMLDLVAVTEGKLGKPLTNEQCFVRLFFK